MIGAVLVRCTEDTRQLVLGQRRDFAGLILRLTALPLEEADSGVDSFPFTPRGA